MDSEHKWEAQSNPLLLNETILSPDKFPQLSARRLFQTILSPDGFPQAKARWMFLCRKCEIFT